MHPMISDGFSARRVDSRSSAAICAVRLLERRRAKNLKSCSSRKDTVDWDCWRSASVAWKGTNSSSTVLLLLLELDEAASVW